MNPPTSALLKDLPTRLKIGQAKQITVDWENFDVKILKLRQTAKFNMRIKTYVALRISVRTHVHTS